MTCQFLKTSKNIFLSSRSWDQIRNSHFGIQKSASTQARKSHNSKILSQTKIIVVAKLNSDVLLPFPSSSTHMLVDAKKGRGTTHTHIYFSLSEIHLIVLPFQLKWLNQLLIAFSPSSSMYVTKKTKIVLTIANPKQEPIGRERKKEKLQLMLLLTYACMQIEPFEILL